MAAVEKLKSLTGTEDRRTAARTVAAEIKEVADLLENVIDQTRRRVFKREKVPAADRVVSVFEPHTDIIEKGGRETVFGHKVLMTVGRGNLVLDAMMEPGNPRDATLFPEALDRQKGLYKRIPESAVGDGGFASAENAKYALGKGVVNVSFTKGVGKALEKLMPSPAIQRLLFKFRAGVEGVLSSLIRGVGLRRCPWKGWEAFQSYVWSSIIAHNVKMLTETIWGRGRRKLARA
jgi:transposase, IS5 family